MSKGVFAQLRLEMISSQQLRLETNTTGKVQLLHRYGFHKEPQECMWVVAYDSGLNVRTVVEIGRGSHKDVDIHLPTMIAAVVTAGCERFMLIHNHPNNILHPSPRDLEATRYVMDAANICGLYFEDHLILGNNGAWMSLADTGYMVPVDYATHSTMTSTKSKSKR